MTHSGTAVWDAGIKRVTDKYPDITVKKLVAPSVDRTGYAKQLLASKGISPFVVGGGKDAFASSLAWTEILGTDLYTQAPDRMKKRRADQLKFTDPAFEKGTAKFADLARGGYIDKHDVSRDYAATQQAFLDGKGAMYPMGSWFAAAADNPRPSRSSMSACSPGRATTASSSCPPSPAAGWTTPPRTTRCSRRSRATSRRATARLPGDLQPLQAGRRAERPGQRLQLGGR